MVKIFVYFFLIITLYSCTNQEGQLVVESIEETSETTEVINLKYGFPIDSFEVHDGKIKPNEFLADILLKYHVSYPEIHELVGKAKAVFDVRRIASGKHYSIFCEKDSTGKAQYFIYEPNPVEFIVFDLRDSIRVYKEEKETSIQENTAFGTIDNSLYVSLKQAGASAALAMEMADIYAWSIDFYRIQKGDEYCVIYDEKFVEETSVGIDRIKAAVFYHRGEPFYAIQFSTDGSIIDYYDDEAKSLRKAFLKSPLKFGRMTSSYSPRRFHPVQKRYKPHLGTDYAASTGTPIMSTGDGTITEAKYSRFNGNYVKVRHNSTYTTQYLHMSKIKSGIRPGVVVKQGDIIGYVGSTGLATGPHVCYRFWKYGKQVDSRREKLPAADPIKDKYKAEYLEFIQPIITRLDSIQGKIKVVS